MEKFSNLTLSGHGICRRIFELHRKFVKPTLEWVKERERVGEAFFCLSDALRISTHFEPHQVPIEKFATK